MTTTTPALAGRSSIRATLTPRPTISPCRPAAARKAATASAGPETRTWPPTSRPEHGPDTDVRAAADSRADSPVAEPSRADVASE